MTSLTAFIVEDSPVIRENLVAALEEMAPIQVVGTAEDEAGALRWLGEFSATITGLLLASYTGVLIGATAIPVWSYNRVLLPPHFLISGLGGAAAALLDRTARG